MEGRYNFDENEADVLFATNEKEEAIEAAKDFGQGTVVISVDQAGNKQRVFTAPYQSELGIAE